MDGCVEVRRPESAFSWSHFESRWRQVPFLDTFVERLARSSCCLIPACAACDYSSLPTQRLISGLTPESYNYMHGSTNTVYS